MNNGSCGFVISSHPDLYADHFATLNGRKEVDLGDGYVAVPTWTIRRKNQNPSEEDVTRSNLLNFNWKPKNSTVGFPQRCPSVWVDNFLFLYKQGMMEPMLLLGRWRKPCDIYGNATTLEGLVLAAGGHYERMANKKSLPDRNNGEYVKFEMGDISLRAAADKEIKEEVGIDPRNIKFTQEFGMMDDVFSDPRCHGIRAGIFLRWVEQTPSPTDELKDILAIPVSQLGMLYNNVAKWKFADGKEFGFILGHDKLVRMVMKHPQTLDFLALVKTFYDK